jgi:hypothetical protein
MKTDTYFNQSGRYLIPGLLAVLTGGYWNLSWFMALPLITLLFPALTAVVTHFLFTRESFGKKTGIYVMTIMASVIMRNILYIGFGQGLDYLLHDGVTQLVAFVLLMEQLVLGIAIIGIASLRSRCR